MGYMITGSVITLFSILVGYGLGKPPTKKAEDG